MAQLAILNSISINGLPVYDPPKGGRPTNTLTMYTGGSRYGYGRFLMSGGDYITLASAANTGSSGSSQGMGLVNLIMLSGPKQPVPQQSVGGKPPTQVSTQSSIINVINLMVVLAGSIPYSTGVTSVLDPAAIDPNELDMVEVIVFDQRVLNTKPITASFNVQYQGFPYTQAGKEVFYYQTLNSGVPYTWTQAITTIELPTTDADNNDQFTSIPYIPHNFIYDSTATNKVYDDIAKQLYLVVGFDYTLNIHKSTIINQFFQPGYESDWNESVSTSAYPYRIKGTDWNRNDSRQPNSIAVCFKQYNRDAPNDFNPSTSRLTTITVKNPTGTGEILYKEPIFIGNWVAVVEGGNVINEGELNNVAQYIADQALSSWTCDFQELEFAGIWPFKLDGSIRAIQWTSNEQNGATTKIKINNETAWNPAEEMMYVIDSFSNQLMIGLGATNTSPSPQGTRFVWKNDDAILGVVTSGGTDARYTVQLALITNSEGSTNNTSLSFGSQSWNLSSGSSGFPSSGTSPTITVTNLTEYLPNTHMLPVGTPVLCFPFPDANGTTRYVTMGGALGAFPVTLGSDGGVNGTISSGSATFATYTYTMTTLGGATLATHQPVWFHRPYPGPVVVATKGLATLGSTTGSYLLIQTDEQGVYQILGC
jgi:hypothetical protein